MESLTWFFFFLFRKIYTPYNEINILEDTKMLNKGLFPFYSFEGTVFEVTEDDDFTMQVAKGAGQTVVNAAVTVGAVALTIGAGYLLK